MTQRERVLAALQGAGGRGVTQVDFLRFPTIDGGPPITRVAARIDELRQAGHLIDSSGTRDRCAVYVLRSGIGESPAAPVAPDVDPGAAGTLFNPAVVNRPLGAYDELDEAA